MSVLSEFLKNGAMYDEMFWAVDKVSAETENAFKEKQDKLLQQMSQKELERLISATDNVQARIYYNTFIKK